MPKRDSGDAADRKAAADREEMIANETPEERRTREAREAEQDAAQAAPPAPSVQSVGGPEGEEGIELEEEPTKAEPKGPTEYDEGGYEANVPTDQ
jgi:hypothetical protein